jgi:hypothetical protein
MSDPDHFGNVFFMQRNRCISHILRRIVSCGAISAAFYPRMSASAKTAGLSVPFGHNPSLR